MIHEPGCEGFHVAEISCERATEVRQAWLKDIYHCRGATPSGYHCFDGDTADAVCLYDGCTRTMGEMGSPSP
jgi:hypothetical protein